MKHPLFLLLSLLGCLFHAPRLAAEIEYDDVFYSGGRLWVVFSDTEGLSNMFTLQEAADLISPTWSESSGAIFQQLSATQYRVIVPAAGLTPEF